MNNNGLGRPVGHLGGNSREALVEEVQTQRNAIEAALQVLKQADGMINGRNFIGRPDQLKWAIANHCERVATLERMSHELLELAYDISMEGK